MTAAFGGAVHDNVTEEPATIAVRFVGAPADAAAEGRYPLALPTAT